MRFLSTLFLLAIFSVSTSFAEVNQIWVSSDYSSGGTNDGHTWGVDAFNSLSNAMAECSANTGEVKVYIMSDLDESDNLSFDLPNKSKIFLNDFDVTLKGNKVGNYSENSYFVCNAGGSLIMLPGSGIIVKNEPQFGMDKRFFFPVGILNLYRPVEITTSEPNKYFGVKVISWSLMPSLCYWDIEDYKAFTPKAPQPQLNGYSSDITFIFDKENVPEDVDVTNESFIYHFPGPEWTNLGAGSTASWNQNSNYWATTINDVTEFSPFTVGSSSLVIPTMTEWALIILGSLLAIGGGILVWRKLS